MTLVSYGDIVYLQFYQNAYSNLLLFSNGFSDDLIYAGKSESANFTPFKSAHFVILPNLLCNTQEKELIGNLKDILMIGQKKTLGSEVVARVLHLHENLERYGADENATEGNEEEEIKEGSEAEEEEKQNEVAPLISNLSAVELLKANLEAVHKDAPVKNQYLESQLNIKTKIEDTKTKRMKALNISTLKEKIGQTVRYVDTVLLFHFESQQFLCASNVALKSDVSLFKLTLSKEITPECYFRFDNSANNTGVDREFLKYDDSLCVQTLDGKHIYASLPINKDKTDEEPVKKDHSSKEYKINQLPEDSHQKSEIFPNDIYRSEIQKKLFEEVYPIGLTKLSTIYHHFCIRSYSTYKDRNEFTKQKMFKNGDYVRIYSAKYFLTATKDAYGQSIVYERYEQAETECNQMNSVFQIIDLDSHSENSALPPTANPLRVQRAPNSDELDEQPRNKGFLLKHYLSGLFLGYEWDEEKTHPKLVLTDKKENLAKMHLYAQISEDEGAPLTRSTMLYLRISMDGKSFFYDDGLLCEEAAENFDMNTKYFIGFKAPLRYIDNFAKVSEKAPTLRRELPTFAKFISVPEGDVIAMNETINFARDMKLFYLTIVNMINNKQLMPSKALSTFRARCQKYYEDLYREQIEEEDVNAYGTSERGSRITNTVNKYRQIYGRECRVLDLANKILFYLTTNPSVEVKLPTDPAMAEHMKKSQMVQICEIVEALSNIILSLVDENIINQAYGGQYIRCYIQAMLNPGGLHTKLATPRHVGSQKEMVATLLKQFLWDGDLHVLGQINFYSKQIYAYILNESDISVQLLDIMITVFDSKNPCFKQSFRDSFMDDFLADANNRTLFMPELIAKENELFFIFRRTNQEPREVSVSNLKESSPETLYLKLLFNLICLMAKRHSISYFVRITKYYDVGLCKKLHKEAIPSIADGVSDMLDAVHYRYMRLPFNGVPNTVKILSKQDGEVYAKVAAMVKNASANLMSAVEREYLDSENFIPPDQLALPALSLSESQRFNLEGLQLNIETLNSAENILGNSDLDQKTLDSLYDKVWTVLKNSAKEINRRKEALKELKRAFTILNEISNRTLTHLASEALNAIRSDPDFASSGAAGLGSITGSATNIQKIEGVVNKNITKSLQRRDQKKENVNMQNFGAGAIKAEDLSEDLKVMIELLQINEWELRSMVLKHLREETKYKSRILKTLRSSAIIDNQDSINGFTVLFECLLNLNNINRELIVMKEFQKEKANQGTLNKLSEAAVRNFEEIFAVVYDYSEHTKTALPMATRQERKAQFLSYIKKVKRELNAPYFALNKSSVGNFWQKILRATNAHVQILEVCETLRGLSEIMPDYYKNENIRLAFRLAFMLIMVFAFDNSENQELLSSTNEFITLFYDTSDEEIDLFGVDRDLSFIEMMRNNEVLLKMDQRYLVDLARDLFVMSIKKDFLQDFSYEKFSTDVWSVSFMKSLAFLTTSNLPLDIFNPPEVLAQLFMRFSKVLSEHNFYSFKTLVASGAGAASQPIVFPVQHYAVESLFEAIQTFAQKDEFEQIGQLRKSVPSKAWTVLLLNQNFRFKFPARKVLLTTFDQVFYNKYKKPGVFKSEQQLLIFVTTLLIDIAGYLDFKNKSDDQKTSYLKNLKKRTWIDKSNKQNEEIGKMIDEYLDIVKKLPVDQLQITNFMNITSISASWIDCITEGTLKLLKSTLTEEKGSFSDIRAEFASNLVNIIGGLREVEQDHKQIPQQVKEIMSILNEFKGNDNWKTALTDIRGKRPQKRQTPTGIFKNTAGGLFGGVLSSPLVQQISTSASKIIQDQVNVKLKQIQESEVQEMSSLANSVKDNKEMIKCIVGFIQQDIIEFPQLSSECQFAISLLIEIIKSQPEKVELKALRMYRWSQLEEDDANRVKEMQDSLVEENLIDLIVKMLEENQGNEKIIMLLYELLTALLFGGNKNSQDRLYELLSDDTENEFMQSLYKNLETQLEYFNTLEKLRIKNLYKLAQWAVLRCHSENPMTSDTLTKEARTEIIKRFGELFKDADKLPNIDDETVYSLNVNVSEYAPKLLQILKMVQCFCEGHHKKFQNFLSQQVIDEKKHLNSVDFIDMMNLAYHNYLPLVNKYNIDFGILLTDLMIETIQGKTRENAYKFLDNVLIDDLTSTFYIHDAEFDLIARGFEGVDYDADYTALKDRVLVFLKDLVEGSPEEKLESARKQINLRYLVKVLYILLRGFFRKKGFDYSPSSANNVSQLRKKIKEITLEENMQGMLKTAVLIYSIIKQFWGMNKLEKRLLAEAEAVGLNEYERSELKLYTNVFCEEYCISVEVVTERNPSLVRVYFPKLTSCNSLEGSEVLKTFEEKVDRSSHQTKMEGLMKETPIMLHHMEVEYKYATGTNVAKRFEMSLWLTNVIIFFMSAYIITEFTFQASDTGESQLTEGGTVGVVFLWIMIGVQILLALEQVGDYLAMQYQTIIAKNWARINEDKENELDDERKNEIQTAFELVMADKAKVSTELCRDILDLEGPSSPKYEALRTKTYYIFSYKRVLELWFVCTDPLFIWQLIFLGLCIGSVFIRFFCALQTLNWIVRSDTVNRVGKAIAKNTRQFLWTLLIQVVVIYIYASIGFYFLNEQFVDEDGNQLCTDVFECFFMTLNLGLRNGGGIGDAIAGENYDEMTKIAFILRIIFDLSFFIIVLILLNNVIFGMIIDAFGDLRDEKAAADEDRKNVCFICNVNREDYEKMSNELKTSTFDQHIQKEHNMKYYVYYIAYLLEKEKFESMNLNDIESYVLACYRRNQDYKWIPSETSLTAENYDKITNEADES